MNYLEALNYGNNILKSSNIKDCVGINLKQDLKG